MSAATISVADLAFPRFRAPDLDRMEAFLAAFGMERSARTADALYMRGTDPQHHVHVTHLGEPEFLGDIVIAIGVARRQARSAGHAFGVEARVLALHGLLHLLGHDHDTDDGRMRRLEARLLRRGGLEEGLIGRAGVLRP